MHLYQVVNVIPEVINIVNMEYLKWSKLIPSLHSVLTEFIFEFENTKPYPMKWNLSSFAPAYLKQADGTVCRTTYSAFRFESTSGEMTPGQKMQVGCDIFATLPSLFVG